MGTPSDRYGEVMEARATQDSERPVRRLHRLPMECYSETGSAFLFTLCARHLGEPFRSPALAEALVGSLLWRHERQMWRLVCYCLMPDHLHFIARLPGATALMNGGARGKLLTGLLEQVSRYKSFTTTQIWWKHNGEGILWQKSSHDRLVHDANGLRMAVAYVLQNPVRAELVTRWEDYPYVALLEPGL